MKRKLKIMDHAFAHCNYSNNPSPPIQSCEFIEWDRTEPNSGEVLFATEANIGNPKFLSHTGKRIAWPIEPRELNRQIYEWLEKNHHAYDYVITHDRRLVNSVPNGRWVPSAGCWIDLKDWKIYDKSKLLSIVASDKNYLPGHKLRHQIINQHRSKIDLYGRGYNPINYKLDSLRDYQYQIIIENSFIDGYFTEKLIDAFATGTIPIYLGDPNIDSIFDSSGMIIVDSFESLDSVIKDLESIDVSQFEEGVKRNFESAKDYILTEDYFCKHYPEIL